jgi:hypothetical protein
MEWLALLIHMGDILGSDLFLETRYYDFFVGFLRPVRQIPGQHLALSHNYSSFAPFQIILAYFPNFDKMEEGL